MANRRELNETMIALIGAALHHKKLENDCLEHIDSDQLLKLCRSHRVSALAAYGLKEADQTWKKEIFENTRKMILFDNEREKILSCMEKKHIWYCNLKGIILKNYYPEYGLREMADNDILFDETKAEALKSIMEELGFKTILYSAGNHDVYYMSPIFNFEMHRSLYARYHEPLIYDYFISVKDRLIKDKNKEYEYHFDRNDFYIYLISHIYKHFSQYGTGLRSLVDVYCYVDKNADLNWNYIAEELRKMNIDSFEENIRSLTLKLFNGEGLSQEQREFLDQIIDSGVYGNIETFVSNSVEKRGKFGHILQRLHTPYRKEDPNYDRFKAGYPFFYRHRLFLPVLPFYRFFHSMIKHRKSLLTEFRALLISDIKKENKK